MKKIFLFSKIFFFLVFASLFLACSHKTSRENISLNSLGYYEARGINYLFGCHPGSSISFVSVVGIRSKEVAYGMNRADYSFISGGVVPGVLILPPDFPENKEDWPFLWGENEYVIPMGPNYILAVKAAEELLTDTKFVI